MHSVLVAGLLSTATAVVVPDVGTLGFSGNTRLDYCAGTKPAIEVSSVNIKNTYPKVITLSGITNTDIADGAVSAVSFKLPYIGGPGQDFNFCKDLGVKCPLKAGESFTAVHNVTSKLWPGFSEDKWKFQIDIVRAFSYPFDILLCIDGPWKGSYTLASHDETEQPLIDEHWEMK